MAGEKRKIRLVGDWGSGRLGNKWRVFFEVFCSVILVGGYFRLVFGLTYTLFVWKNLPDLLPVTLCIFERSMAVLPVYLSLGIARIGV